MTTNVALLLQPHAERNRSMMLYAERLAANAQPAGAWRVHRLRSLRGDRKGRWSELLVPPLAVPRVQGDVLHVVDHAHAGYARSARRPVVVTVHDLIPLKTLRGEIAAPHAISRRAAWWFRWNIAALRRARHLVSPSRATADDLRRLLGLDATVVPHGVDDIFFAPPSDTAAYAVARALAPLANRPIVLTVGGNFFYKNLAGCAAAMAALRVRRPDVLWVHVGARLDAGHPDLTVPDADLGLLRAWYGAASALLFPSWDEGFGWPPLEAMAAGCPVVASSRGALAETAAPAARIVEPDDPRGMAVALAEILEDPLRAADLRDRGMAHAAKWRWPRAAMAMAEIYAEAHRDGP